MPDYAYEEQLSSFPVIGIDEVGYGAWAGPVVVAGVFLDLSMWKPRELALIDDSKKLTAKKRGVIDAYMAEGEGTLVFSHVVFIEAPHIDQVGIKKATHFGIEGVVRGLLKKYPSHKWGGVLMDGLTTPHLPLPARCIVKGDQKSLSIAAASVMAKEARDRVMRTLSQSYPHYGWETNVGYGTKDHQKGILTHGCCGHHRFSYKPLHQYKERAVRTS